ncbi:MAG: NAD-dependent epimerase/dehydratase family protein [Pseudomonadota bacterium]|nr:NAD-dependent epimerase/dehydratase family protein [Pseudomonadota bacterium]
MNSTNEKMNFVIMGAGYTGLSVAKKLPPERTVCISRSKNISINCRSLSIDLDRSTDKIESPELFSVLYTIPPNPNIDKDLRLIKFLKAITTAPKRIVYISSSGVYGDRQGALTDESVKPAPKTKRAIKRLQSEKFLKNWCNERNIELIILRVAGIYGPGRLGVDKIKKGLTVIKKDEEQPSNRIHIEDLTSCCINALTKRKIKGIYNISDGNHKSQSWFVKTICHQMKLNMPTEISRKKAKNTWNQKRLTFLEESRRIDTRKMRKDLLDKLRYPDPEKGIREILSQ